MDQTRAGKQEITSWQLKEAKFVASIIQAIRVTINSERWKREHQVTNLGGVWRLWDVDRRGKLNSSQFVAALSLTFPSAAPMAEAELDIVLRFLDTGRRGEVTHNTFISVFSPRACDLRPAAAKWYAALPTWGEATGGYIPRNEKVPQPKARLAGGLNHKELHRNVLRWREGGSKLADNASAPELGLGHADFDAPASKFGAGYKYSDGKPRPRGGGIGNAHADLEANAARFGHFGESPGGRRGGPGGKFHSGHSDLDANAVKWEHHVNKGRCPVPQSRRRRGSADATAVGKRHGGGEPDAEDAEHWADECCRAAVLAKAMQNTAARRIQRAFRAWQASARRRQAEVAEAEQRRRRDAAAVTIQTCFRRHLFRRGNKARRIQRAYRVHLARRLIWGLREVRRATNHVSRLKSLCAS